MSEMASSPSGHKSPDLVTVVGGGDDLYLSSMRSWTNSSEHSSLTIFFRGLNKVDKNLSDKSSGVHVEFRSGESLEIVTERLRRVISALEGLPKKITDRAEKEPT